MKTLYLDCGMGAAGDMLMAALLELCTEQEKEKFLETMNHRLGLPGVTVEAEPAVKCGITGTHMTVKVHGEEEGSHDHGHTDHHSHTHDHDDVHSHDDSHSHEHTHNHDTSHGHEHTHSHDDSHGHEHAHSHDESHGHEHTHSHSHSRLHDIEHIISHMEVSEQVKADVLAVYKLIAEAESHAHGVPVEEIHFHEVGTMDAVADVTGVCLLMEQLEIGQVIASPVHVGSGQVRCAHGILPVPAPATAYMLQDVPFYGGSIQGELCTPTGAALLKHFVSRFGAMPVMKVAAIGYGCGKKDFEAANCVRASLGETLEGADEVVELCCNLDDMTPEALGFAQEELLAAGALDVYTTAIGMKKCRPGVMLTCMCRREQADQMKELLFRHTTTLGIREYVCSRTTLQRTIKELDTEFGTLHRKEVSGWGVQRGKLEYEELAEIAREKGMSLEEVRQRIESR